MAKHSKHFTQSLKIYLSAGNGERHKYKWHNKGQQLPDALKLSILRGEMIFRQQFFDYFESKGFDDNFSYLAYQKIVVSSNVITEFVQQIGLQKATEEYIQSGIATTNSNYHQQCYQLYCLFVDHLANNDETKLLHNATVALVQHYLPSFFPKVDKVKPSLETLQKQLRKALNIRWHCQVKIRESFTTTDSDATMRLIAYVDKCHPAELICTTQKRLRSAKFKAYHQVLEQINNGDFDITPIPKIKKKSQPMMPLVE
ncbi:hypothetical protein [Phocoenobacter skyensis]|uniref:Uncharacterized protein n=1 Tax=Phocoenobacter skyensis TaxID=97481 RepID=A0A1H7ZVT6_9PAST|nr:hypothetical protein [Pasteurella skyensis]MDP8186044.1 hypothetical protein [Pasteurella skyensis]QLB22041.1 hypothetical protein A6B44_02010 [Pasteurella skyensis]SEM61698.1 hypothetical protein SAMN05444853_1308 [Pasteurella skyensis]